MSTTLITHSDCLKHAPDPTHPESPARIKAILTALDATPDLHLIHEDAPLATADDLMLCHPKEHVEKVLRLMPKKGRMKFDIDTSADAGTYNARHALERHGLSRVAIVDFDVHHANGTQDLLWDEPRTLLVSSHQGGGFWPGSGHATEIGAHNNVLNIPLKNRSGGLDIRDAYETTVFPRLEAFKPELLLISAGFDAHAFDAMSGLRWATDDYAWITRRLLEVTRPFTSGKTVSCLEGGYDLPSLADSVAAHVTELARGE